MLCGESEEGLKVMVKHFVEVCRKIGLKVNADKSKMIMLGGKKGLFWMNQVQMLPSVVGPWLILGVCSLSVQECCMRHYLCLLFCTAVRQ